jgi:hypothetical protein
MLDIRFSEEYYLLECYFMLPVFGRIVLPPSSQLSIACHIHFAAFLLGLLCYPEDGDSIVL